VTGNTTGNIACGMPRLLARRYGHWHFVRRVPLAFTDLDKRGIVKQSTGIPISEDPNGAKAVRVRDRLNAVLEQYWLDLANGQAQEAQRRYDGARRRARVFGFDYAPAAVLAERPLLELLERVEKLLEAGLLDDAGAAAALLGGEPKPALKLSEVFPKVEELTRGEIADMSPDQIRKWRHPRLRAMNNLIAVVGDKNVHELQRADGIDFRDWWSDRVVSEGLRAETANKDLGHVEHMLSQVDKRLQLDLQPVFADLRLDGPGDGVRAAFEPAFVRDRILATGAMDDLNEEARDVVYVMAETGMRISEIVNLSVKTIAIAAEIPHVMVRPEGRRMKTSPSRREIPLVGIALTAMRRRPDGFPRYRDKPSTLSAVVNKHLAKQGLRPTEDHSLYSLRHTFKDRLREVEAPEELVDELMGHGSNKPKYGTGHGLKMKRKWLQKIAFKVAA
jgi:site-specific recombinase XerC